MRVFVLPVSGGAFPIQLGFISELTDINVIPDLVMGSSGGNVAAYVSLAANWESSKIPEITSKINHRLFVSSWWPRYLTFMPSWIIGYFKGSMYDSGSGIEKVFASLFNDETITKTEIWTGTLNRDHGKGQFFCNRSKSNSVIQPLAYTLPTIDSLQLTYMDGNIDLITKVSVASASIPVLVPEQIINDQHYVDGGMIFSSPFTALHDNLNSITDICHIDYINSYDIQNSNRSSYDNIYENSTLTINELITSLCVSDRLSAINMLRYYNKPLYFVSLIGNQDNLKLIENFRKSIKRSVLEFYPSISIKHLDLSSFEPDDIVKIITEARNNYSLRFWWTCDNDHHSSIFPQVVKLT